MIRGLHTLRHGVRFDAVPTFSLGKEKVGKEKPISAVELNRLNRDSNPLLRGLPLALRMGSQAIKGYCPYLTKISIKAI